MVRAVNAAEVIDSHDALERLHGAQLVEARVHADAGVVDQRVDAAIFGDSALDQRPALRLNGDIRWNCKSPGSATAGFPGCVFEEVWFSRSEHQPGALRRQLIRQLAANTGRAA